MLFSSFMAQEYKTLDQWYKDNKGKISRSAKQKRLRAIQDRLLMNLQSKMKTRRFGYFSKIELNNARLLSISLL